MENLFKKLISSLTLFCLLVVFTSTLLARQSDNGDGTYSNPPLYADFPDPDIIRVGDDFYFATTTFVNTPGLTILHSQDLVNWRYLSHVIKRLNGRSEYDLQKGTAYRSGIFAPSLRYHNGTFYVAVTPVGQKTRIYTAKDARGPWNYIELDRGAFDPALFFDDDGKGYVATSAGYDGTLTLLTLNEDYTEIEEAKKVFFNRGAEGSKIIKRGDWYYLFQSIPRRLGMDISRAKSLNGPWETKRSIDDRTGGHQGAIVDLPDGSWYGFVMCDFKSVGRITNISPIFWQDDWPMWGTPDAPGTVPDVATKPIQGKPVLEPATSDQFDSDILGLQWQWNHNPDDNRWSLTERPGYLRLKATQSDQFWTARNTLTQKGWGPWCQGTVTLDLSHLKPGDICGFGTLGKFNGHIFITCNEQGELTLGKQVIEDIKNGQKTHESEILTSIQTDFIMLRTEMDFEIHKGKCSYSLDGQNWSDAGQEFPLQFDWQTGTFQGQQFAIFYYNPESSAGFVDVDSFILTDDKSAQQIKPVFFDNFEYTGEDINATAPLSSDQYRNPILAGFHPDPSICRAGKDYYLINSTFEYFPGLPIFHSTDLVNWKQIGHVIHRPEQLNFRNRRVSAGLFAPAITYHDGLFYVVCTKIDGPGNFVVTAENPAGPWSDPMPLRFGGIDPSIFFDEDGTAWIVYNDAPEGRPLYDGHRAVWIQQFDPKNKKMYESRKLLINGGVDISKKPVWIEGPHIYKLKGWYYLCCAEGGTSTQHSQVIFRSKEVDGPYIPWDKNPILTQRDLDSNAPNAVTCTGHADLVIGPDNNWWAVFLAVRPYKNGLSPMGRETFLLPVNWTDDDWPIILPPGERVPLVSKSPNGVEIQASDAPLNGSFTWSDDFKQKDLSLEWIMLREPEEEWWNVNTTTERLELTPRSETLRGSGNPSFLGRRVRHAKYMAALSVGIPKNEGISSGLVLFMNERYHYFLAVQYKNGKTQLYLEKVEGRDVNRVGEVELSSLNEIDLRVKADKATCSFEYKTKDSDWKTLVGDADATIITSAVRDGMFLGAIVGPHVRIDEPE